MPPDRALAAYGVIAYMDTVRGVFFPRGGMRRIGQALADAATAAGAEIHYGRTVTGLAALRRPGHRGPAPGHRRPRPGAVERLDADAVVLTPDLRRRLPDHRPDARAARCRLRYSPSAVVLHAGLRRTRPELAHHTISFGAAWRGTFREIIDDGRPMSDPSLLITRPTATDPGLAPPGADLLFVLAPCPNTERGDIDWAEFGPRYRDQLLAVLAERGHPG